MRAEDEAAAVRDGHGSGASPRRRRASPLSSRASLVGLHALCAAAHERAVTEGEASVAAALYGYLQRMSATARSRCELLYEESHARRARAAERSAAHAQQAEAQAQACCTFSPTLGTPSPSRAPRPDAPDSFWQRCQAWRARTAAKLLEHSRALEQEAKGAAVVSRHVNHEDSHGAGAVTHSAKSRFTRETSTPPRHVPVTREVERRAWSFLRDLTRRAEDATTTSTTTTTATTMPARTVAAFLRDVEDDLRRRADRAACRVAAARAAQDDPYEPLTGRPLFTPNALPTVMREGVRVPFDQLTRAEQSQLLASLRRHGVDLGAVPAHSHRDVVSAQAALHRLLERNAASAARRATAIAVLRATAAAESPFQPRITPRSARLARRKTAGVKIYDRPLPVAPAPSATTPRERLVRTSSAEMAEMWARSEAWLRARALRRRRAHAERAARELQECPFTPQRAALHAVVGHDAAASTSEVKDASVGSQRHGSVRVHRRALDELAAAADVRLRHELQQLEARAALRAATMPRPSVPRRGSTTTPSRARQELTLRSAPRLATRSTSLLQPPHDKSYAASRRVEDSPYASPIDPYDDYDDDDDDDFDLDRATRLAEDDDDDLSLDAAQDGDEEESDWAELDAQTDAILRRLAYTP